MIDGLNGFLTDPLCQSQVAERLIRLLSDPQLASRMGRRRRTAAVANWSLKNMVEGYQDLIADVYRRKAETTRRERTAAAGESILSRAVSH